MLAVHVMVTCCTSGDANNQAAGHRSKQNTLKSVLCRWESFKQGGGGGGGLEASQGHRGRDATQPGGAMPVRRTRVGQLHASYGTVWDVGRCVLLPLKPTS